VVSILEVLLDSSAELVEIKVFLNKTSVVVLKSTTFKHNRQCLFVCTLWKLNPSTDITEYNKLEVEVVMSIAVFPFLGVYLRHICQFSAVPRRCRPSVVIVRRIVQIVGVLR
jgi:hypothetical protein